MKSQKSKCKLISDPSQLKPITYTSVFYDDNAAECVEKEALCRVDNGNDGSIRYYLKTDNNAFVDVLRDNYSRRNKYKWKWINVPKDSFESYVAYLTTKKSVCYTNAMNSFYRK